MIKWKPDYDLGEWKTSGRYSMRLETHATDGYQIIVKDETTGFEDNSQSSPVYIERSMAATAYWAYFECLRAITRLTSKEQLSQLKND